MTIATMIVMNRCHVSTTLPMSIPCLSAKNSGSGEIAFSSQIVVGETHEEEHEADRHHELHHERRVHQLAHDQALDDRAEQRRGDEDHEDQRERAPASAG